MINIEQIQNEIEIVKETIISNEEQLLHFKKIPTPKRNTPSDIFWKLVR